MKKAIITGATGMIGGLILKECIDSTYIDEVIILTRKPIHNKSKKVKEIICEDHLNIGQFADHFKSVDIVYYCLGAYTGAVSNDLFKLITVDYPIVLAKILKEQSPNAVLCLLSGAGADRSEQSETAFAKYKGMTENALEKLELGGLFIFRPGYIYPVIKRKAPNMMYSISRSLYPLIRLLGSKFSIKSTELASAMFNVINNLPPKMILENDEILATLPDH